MAADFTSWRYVYALRFFFKKKKSDTVYRACSFPCLDFLYRRERGMVGGEEVLLAREAECKWQQSGQQNEYLI
jgi:hypothetical protein